MIILYTVALVFLGAAKFLIDRRGVDLVSTRSICERFVRTSLTPSTSERNP